MSESLHRSLLVAAVAAFAALSFFYAWVWMAAVRWEPPVDLGATFDAKTLEVVTLRPGGPAEQGGLTLHDKLLALGADPLETRIPLSDALRQAEPGDVLRLMVSLAGLNTPRSYDVILGPPEPAPRVSWLVKAAGTLAWSFPLLVLAVATVALVVRRELREAWLFAVVATGLVATLPLVPYYEGIPPALRGVALAFKMLLAGAAPALLYSLLCALGGETIVDERVPWLRQAWPGAALAVGMPLAVWSLNTGGFEPSRGRWPALGLALVALSWLAAIVLGLLSLETGRGNSTSADRGRRVRVVSTGVVAAALPVLLLGVAWRFTGAPPHELPLVLRLMAALGVLLLVLACAYVVTVSRALDVQVLLRRGARALLVGPGARPVVRVAVVALALAAADLSTRFLAGGLRAVAGVAVCVAVYMLTVRPAMRTHARASDDIERRLFPREHATRRILARLAEDVRAARTSEELASFLGKGLAQAFEPLSLAVYVTERERGQLAVASGAVARELREIPLDRPLLPEPGGATRPIGTLDRVAELGPDCLVPLAGRQPGLLGLVVLGPRRTDEPYSGEEQGLLAAVGRGAGQALERLKAESPSPGPADLPALVPEPIVDEHEVEIL